MAISYEVSSVFSLQDEMSPALDRIIDTMQTLVGVIDEVQGKLRGLGRSAAGALDAAIESAENLEKMLVDIGYTSTTSSEKIGAGMSVALEKTDALVARVLELNTALEVGGGLGGGFGGGGGGSGGGSGGGRSHGILSLLSGTEPLIEAAAVYESFKGAWSEDTSLTQTVQSIKPPGGASMDPDSKQGKALIEELRRVVENTARGTIYSNATTAEMFPAAAHIMQLENVDQLRKFEELAPILVRGAEVMTQSHLGNSVGNAEAMVHFAHMVNEWDPSKMDKDVNMLGTLSLRTQSSPAQQVNVLKYLLPLVSATGGDIPGAMAATEYLEQSWGPTSTSGTGLANMLLEGLPRGNESGRKTSESWAHIMGLTTPKRTAAETKAHDRALQNLGLMDEKGQPTWLGPHGEPELLLELEKIREAHDRMKPAEFLENMSTGLAIRGERSGVMFAREGAKERLQAGSDDMNNPFVMTHLQAQLANTPMQKFDVMIANLENIGIALAQVLTPLIGDILTVLNETLQPIAHFFAEHSGVGKVVAGTALGAMIGGAPGAAIGAILGGTDAILTGNIDDVEQNMRARNEAMKKAGLNTKITPDPNVHPMAYHPDGSGGFNIGAINIHGAPADADAVWVRRIMGQVMLELNRAMSHDTGLGNGSHQSAYLTGAA